MCRWFWSSIVCLLVSICSCADHNGTLAEEVTSERAQQPDRLLIYDQDALATYSIDQLLYLLTIEAVVAQHRNGVDDSYVADVREELARRGSTGRLVTEFEKSDKDDWYRLQILFVLYGIQDTRIRETLEGYDPDDTDEITYYRVNYLAKLGDTQALKVLNDNYGEYPVSSVQWANSVEQFGKYKYKPAVPNLIASLDHMSLNVVSAAGQSLAQIYSVSTDQFHSTDEVKEYFNRLYGREVEK